MYSMFDVHDRNQITLLEAYQTLAVWILDRAIPILGKKILDLRIG